MKRYLEKLQPSTCSVSLSGLTGLSPASRIDVPSISVKCNKHGHYRELVNEATYNKKKIVYTQRPIHMNIIMGKRKHKGKLIIIQKKISKLLTEGEGVEVHAKSETETCLIKLNISMQLNDLLLRLGVWLSN